MAVARRLPSGEYRTHKMGSMNTLTRIGSGLGGAAALLKRDGSGLGPGPLGFSSLGGFAGAGAKGEAVGSGGGSGFISSARTVDRGCGAGSVCLDPEGGATGSEGGSGRV